MRNTVSIVIRTLPLLAVSACALALESRAHEIDGIAAKVGSETILRSDVYEEMRRAGARDASRYEEVRNEMIERKLILKAAADAKMTMQEWVVDNRIREITEKAFEGDRNKLIAALAAEKLPYTEFRQRIKDDLIVTASPEFLVGEAGRRLGVRVIGTRMDVRTGRIEGENCHDEEKVRRFRAAFRVMYPGKEDNLKKRGLPFWTCFSMITG